MEMPSKSKPSSRVLCAALVTTALLLGYLAAGPALASKKTLTSKKITHTLASSREGPLHERLFVSADVESAAQPFILCIEVQFNSLEGVAHFTELFSAMARWVHANEPGTTSYSFSVSDKDPLRALVFEQYVDKHAYAEVHKSSAQFLEFKRKMVAMNDEDVERRLGWRMTGQSYRQQLGFI